MVLSTNLYTQRRLCIQAMNTQVISYRLSTEEVLQLRQKGLPRESDSQIAQRLMREALGVSTSLSTSLQLLLMSG
jgi:ribose 1,5-bisphosphokinase PhnN